MSLTRNCVHCGKRVELSNEFIAENARKNRIDYTINGWAAIHMKCPFCGKRIRNYYIPPKDLARILNKIGVKNESR